MTSTPEDETGAWRHPYPAALQYRVEIDTHAQDIARTYVTCPACKGYGEVPVHGTYGPTVSPEALEVTLCRACMGGGELTLAALADFEGAS